MLQFKFFVSVAFQEALERLSAFKGFSEEERMTLFRFKTKYQKEVKIFGERYSQLQQAAQAKIKELEGQEDKIKEENDEFLKKVQEILDLESELKPLDYEKIKKAEFSITDLELFVPVLKNLPEE